MTIRPIPADPRRLGETLEATVALDRLADPAHRAVSRFLRRGPLKDLLHGVQLGHPLLPASRCVRNDVSIISPTRVLLISGSNMSGKSTLLRSIGINAVLAQAGGPVCAAELRMPVPFQSKLVPFSKAITKPHDSPRY